VSDLGKIAWKRAHIVFGGADAGLRAIEAGSFVSPQWVPQMADSTAVMRAIRRDPGVSYPVLTPNMRGCVLFVCGDQAIVFVSDATMWT
jgi:isopropylmalate/homocitrate/citramalate synthase